MNSITKASKNRGKTSKKKNGKTPQEWDQLARNRKRQKRHRGNPSGSRQNRAAIVPATNSENGHDKRIGSKRPVPLLVGDDAPVVRASALSPQEELAQRESDPLLNRLLCRLDEGDALSPEEQDYLDGVLDRIDELMEMLGIELTAVEEEEKR